VCNFLSAIVTQGGRVFANPEATDSHEDLVKSFGLKDDTSARLWCRVEFSPMEPADLPYPERYRLQLDEESSVPWWNEDVAAQVVADLSSMVRAMLVSDSREILAGGCWILHGNAQVSVVHDARIVAMLDSARVGEMRGSALVDAMCDSARVNIVCDSAWVGEMYDSASIGEMIGSAWVNKM